MYIDKKWRTSVIDTLLTRAQEDSMKTTEKVLDLVQTQFNDFIEPIEELSEVSFLGNTSRYKVYDRALDVECLPDKILFYRVSFSSDNQEKERELVTELLHNGKVFIRKGKNSQRDEYVNSGLIEYILNQTFSLGIALRK